MSFSSILILSILVAVSTCAAETVLIDRSKGNADFENGSLTPWRSAQDTAPTNVVEKGQMDTSMGEWIFHIQSRPSDSSGHDWDSICQDVQALGTSGSFFSLSMNVRGGDIRPSFTTFAQLVFFDADGKTALATISLGEKVVGGVLPTLWTSKTIQAPSAWTGGRIEVRIGSLIRKGIPETTCDAFIDNVRLVQGDTPQVGTVSPAP